MFIARFIETMRDATRDLSPDPSVTTVEVKRPAANANRWSGRRVRSLRSGRWMARSAPRHIHGWTVRTW